MIDILPMLTDTCVIQYNAAAVAGDSGHMAPANWQTLASDVPCKLSGSGGATEDYHDRAISVRRLTIYFAPETTITAQHRIVLNSQTYEVNGVDAPTAHGAIHYKGALVTLVE